MGTDDLDAITPQVDDRARRALATAESWLDGDVVGAGLGETVEGEPCVIVYVTRPDAPGAQKVPSEVEGLPVRLEVTGPFQAL